jgi:hypothetical protein
MKNNSDTPENKLEAVVDLHKIFSDIRELLNIDRKQSTYGKLFDMLSAIEDVNLLLDEAWKVSKLNNIADDNMRREFIEIVDEFGKLKYELKRDFIDKKH